MGGPNFAGQDVIAGKVVIDVGTPTYKLHGDSGASRNLAYLRGLRPNVVLADAGQDACRNRVSLQFFGQYSNMTILAITTDPGENGEKITVFSSPNGDFMVVNSQGATDLISFTGKVGIGTPTPAQNQRLRVGPPLRRA